MIIPVLLLVIVIGVGGVLFVNAQQETALLEKFDLSNISIIEMVDKLEGVEKGLLNTTINTEYVVINDGDTTAKVKIPEDKFFLAFAPYINETEPCSEYNLTTCQGELANQTFLVEIISPNGDPIVKQEMTSLDNGFVSIWLDKNIEANLIVTYNNLRATAFITTFDDSNTCITTPLQLTK
jgi:hypothetical protein